MSTSGKPWHGVAVVTAVRLRRDLPAGDDRNGEQVHRRVDTGHAGVRPNGSPGGYRILTAEGHARIVRGRWASSR